MDIDIDLQSDFDPLDIFPEATRASMVKQNKLVKHNVGVYFQDIPIDKITGLAAIPYDKAEELGYFKIDFLHLHFLDHLQSKDEVRKLIDIEPDWSMLEDRDIVEKLQHIHNHFDLISQIQPKCIQELADCLALIRPAKRKLLNAYLKDREKTRKFLYQKSENGRYYFKKGHAISYALNIVIQMHLIKAEVL